MLRAAGLHLLRGGIQRFSTASHPTALGACYVASWQLPRPDLHQLAVGSLRTHQRLLGGLFLVTKRDSLLAVQ